MLQVSVLWKNHRICVPVKKNTLVSEALLAMKVPVHMPCSGKHLCGKCRVWVSGEVNEVSPQENALLGDAALAEGIRLACFCRIEGDSLIRPVFSQADILTWAKIPSFLYTGTGAGVACDIGTTTIAVRLYECSTGKLLAEEAEENNQRAYGADVISRIQACHEYGTTKLSEVVFRQIEDMVGKIMKKSAIREISAGVLTGNTTMLHIFEGLDPHALAAAPFLMQSAFGSVSARRIDSADMYLPPCIGAYVGADTVCAVLAAGMTEQKGISLLVDLGTNGEIVLCKDGKFICCAVAAGPAFEGVGLHSGMSASCGAICKAHTDEGKVSVEIIGNGVKAAGICGSGIIDLLHVMKNLGVLDESGYLEKEFSVGTYAEVCITPEDVRKIQLAKAAVCAGIYTLLNEENVMPEEVEHFYVAGGFGASLNPVSAAAIGLFPEALKDKISFIGNGALGGAVMILLNSKMKSMAEDIVKNSRELELSRSAFFMDKYIECMGF